ncbi:MAG: methyltransferase domain-containing protein, partial [Steroidobacteraceae bacterium]
MQNDATLVFTGERFHPEISGNIELEHMHRYIYALAYAEGKTILDIASGEGYGAALLASRAVFVTGVDIAEDAVAHAREKYHLPNLEFRVGSCSKIPLGDGAVDFVVSFETIEHHAEHEQMLSEIKRVLKPGGMVLVSSPDKAIYTDKRDYHNPFHVKELYRDEFEALFRRHFENVGCFGQKVMFGSGIIPDIGAAAVDFASADLQGTTSSPGLPEAEYNLVLASDAPLPAAPLSFLDVGIDASETVRQASILNAELAARVRQLEADVAHVRQLEADVARKDTQIAEYLYHLGRINASPWWRFGMWLTRHLSPNRVRVKLHPPARNLRKDFIVSHGDAAIYFPQVTEPEVSIIIPAYRGLADLEACLRSLSVYRATEPSFEVIVLDDCPDEPVLSAIPSSGGLIKIANEKNLGFLLTCNRGAAVARGHILCFLNSDTIVSAGWLRSLVEALDEVPRAAVAGGMLLNVDGTIQDAGWRILADGWGYAIGRGGDSRNGAYTYRRSVDCVTGACFVVPQKVWNELGGFDTAYAPAFYEEFDFAFRAQALGLQVIYEPRSRVLHLGSASYGAEQRDQLSSINHAKFCERFADVLRKHPLDTADEFTLRHASGEGPVLLVIDHSVPQPDQHAGDVTMSRYLAMLATAGWRVVFGPMNGRAEGPAAEALERQGIELIRAPVTIEEWLTKYGKHVREVWLARPEVAKEMLAPLRAHTDAHITYYTHDLHHLRLQRQAELHADPELKAKAAEVKALECKIFRSVDRVTTPSAAEAEIVRHLSPETPVTVLPPYYYDAAEICTYDARHFTALSDVVFVGGFPHPPNVDAALFIAKEVMPLVWRKRPEVRLLLIGYAPPAEVQALAGPRIVVTGQVPKLEPFFDASRVF